jgi:hypothetical protein
VEKLSVVLKYSRDMAQTGSPERPKPKERIATRYGPIQQGSVSFAKEERFSWQKPKFQSDVAYNPQLEGQAKPIVFGGSLRTAADDNPDAKKRSTGPGSYDIQHAPNFLSSYIRHDAARFSIARRESMAEKTPSPGAVYNIQNQYWNGPVKTQKIGFNKDKRRPLYSGGGGDADMLWPSLPKGRSVTIGKKLPRKEKGSDTPGAYNVKQDFRTGPSISFGKGRGDRFASFGILRGTES